MTERIYYTDPYAREFDATVVRATSAGADGSRLEAILDRTAFYPTSGGQPFDVGSLNGSRVVDVVDADDGTIVHVVEGALQPGPAHGSIDWRRRFDHMQQHTGQHVLSAAFDRLLQVRTVSFHLGTTSSTIDLSREVRPEEIGRAEQEANRIVWEDRPVTIRFADSAEAATIKLRKEPTREGTLRLIEIEDFDISACGGTHVARTGAIGNIAIAGAERFRGGTRVEFVCGGRALDAFRALRDSVTSSTRLLSVLPAELPAGIERLQAEQKDQKRQIRDLQTRLAGHEAAALVDRAPTLGNARVIVEVLEGWDANGLKTIASAIVERTGNIAVLIGRPSPSPIVVARSADLGADSAAILKAMIAAFGGKGGGRPELAQGGGLQGTDADFIKTAQQAVAQVIGG